MAVCSEPSIRSWTFFSYSRWRPLNWSAALARTSASVIGWPSTTASTVLPPESLVPLSWPCAEQAGIQTPRARTRNKAPGIRGLRNPFIGLTPFGGRFFSEGGTDHDGARFLSRDDILARPAAGLPLFQVPLRPDGEPPVPPGCGRR